MSVKAISWALDDVKGIHPTQKLVLLALANEATTDGQGAFIGAATIAEVTGIGERQVRYHLKDLERVGLISRGDQRRAAYIDARHRPTVYNLMLTNIGRVQALVKGKPVKPHHGAANLWPAAPKQEASPESNLGVHSTTGAAECTPESKPRGAAENTPRGAMQRSSGVHSGVHSASGDPLTLKITPVASAECKTCNRHFKPELLTSTGYCRDCLIFGPDPASTTIGPGLAAVREMLATRRQPNAGNSAEFNSTSKEA